MSLLTEQIERIIRSSLPDATVTVSDPMNDGAHLEAVVISESFAGLSLVEQHRRVMNALKEEFAGDLHALKLKTRTPE
ncbi:MAG: BolA/IbaG family iron-sulfur metabolism protein [Planctomycetota bacterium]